METEAVRAGEEVREEVAEAAEDMMEALSLFDDIIQLSRGALWRLRDMLGKGDLEGVEPMDMPEAVADDVRAIACMLEEQVIWSAESAAGTASKFVGDVLDWLDANAQEEGKEA